LALTRSLWKRLCQFYTCVFFICAIPYTY
jgi:hypothetical protein